MLAVQWNTCLKPNSSRCMNATCIFYFFKKEQHIAVEIIIVVVIIFQYKEQLKKACWRCWGDPI